MPTPSTLRILLYAQALKFTLPRNSDCGKYIESGIGDPFAILLINARVNE